MCHRKLFTIEQSRLVDFTKGKCHFYHVTIFILTSRSLSYVQGPERIRKKFSILCKKILVLWNHFPVYCILPYIIKNCQKVHYNLLFAKLWETSGGFGSVQPGPATSWHFSVTFQISIVWMRSNQNGGIWWRCSHGRIIYSRGIIPIETFLTMDVLTQYFPHTVFMKEWYFLALVPYLHDIEVSHLETSLNSNLLGVPWCNSWTLSCIVNWNAIEQLSFPPPNCRFLCTKAL